MKIQSGSADRFASAPDPKIAAVLVYGPDRGLARERARSLITAWKVDPQDPFGLVEIGEDEIKGGAARLADELRALSLTGGPRAVRVRVGGDSAAETFKTVLRQIDSGDLVPEAHLVVEGGDLAARSKLRAAFETAGRAAAVPCYEDSEQTLSRLLDATLKEAKLTMTPDARARFLPHLEGDRGLARAELEKLVLYKGPGAPDAIMPEDVDAIAAGAEPTSLDDVVDATLGGDVAGADRALALAFGEGVTGVGIVRALQRRLYALHQAAGALRRSGNIDEILKNLRPPLFGPRQSAFRAQLSLWPAERIDAAIDQALRTEVALKSAGAADETLTGRLMLALARQAQRARR